MASTRGFIEGLLPVRITAAVRGDGRQTNVSTGGTQWKPVSSSHPSGAFCRLSEMNFMEASAVMMPIERNMPVLKAEAVPATRLCPKRKCPVHAGGGFPLPAKRRVSYALIGPF